MIFKILIVISAFCYGVIGQVPFTGKCPEIKNVQENFDLNRYLGTWYEAEKFFTVFELGGKCNLAVYSLNDNGTVKVHNQQINKSSLKLSFIEGYATPADRADEAKLLVRFPSKMPFAAPYWVLGTDYDSYSVVWSCTELPLISTKFAWILTRDRNPSEEVIKKAYAVFDNLNLSREDLLKTDQNDCPGEVN